LARVKGINADITQCFYAKKASGFLTLVYGKSVTDGCIGWDDTETLLRDLATAVKARRG